MRNLLPERSIRRLKNEYRLRLATIVLLLVCLAALVGSVALIPAYVLARSKLSAIQTQAQLVGQSIAQREGQFSFEALRTTQLYLEYVRADRARTNVSDVIAVILSKKPAGVAMERFFFTFEAEGGGAVTLSGRAARRDDLLAFKDMLEELALLSEISLPISNLAAGRDISFTFEAVLNP